MSPRIERALEAVPIPKLVWTVVLLIVMCAIGAGTFLLADQNSEDRGKNRQLEEVAICERANIGRAVILANAIEAKDERAERRIRAVTPLIDCFQSVRTHNPDVPLPVGAVDEILKIVTTNQTPRRVPGRSVQYTE